MTAGAPDYFAGFAFPIQLFTFPASFFDKVTRTYLLDLRFSPNVGTINNYTGRGRLVALGARVTAPVTGTPTVKFDVTLDGVTQHQAIYDAANVWSPGFGPYARMGTPGVAALGANQGDVLFIPMLLDFLTGCTVTASLSSAATTGELEFVAPIARLLNA